MNDYEFLELADQVGPNPIQIVKMLNDDHPGRLVNSVKNAKVNATQATMGVEATAYVWGTGTSVDNEIAVLKILDPLDYSQTFPDWKERCQGNFVLAQIYHPTDPSGLVGWIHRSRLAPISNEAYDQIREGITAIENPYDLVGTGPTQLDEWRDIGTKAAEAMIAENNEAEGRPALRCSQCDSTNAFITTRHTHDVKFRAVISDEKIACSSIIDTKERKTAYATCEDCGHKAVIDVDKIG